MYRKAVLDESVSVLLMRSRCGDGDVASRWKQMSVKGTSQLLLLYFLNTERRAELWRSVPDVQLTSDPQPLESCCCHRSAAQLQKVCKTHICFIKTSERKWL